MGNLRYRELFDKVVVVGYLNQAGFLISAAREPYIFQTLDVLERSDGKKCFPLFKRILKSCFVRNICRRLPIVLHEA